MISLRGISSHRSGADALVDVSFEIARGESVALLGAGGSARTTLLRILATLVRPSSGHLTIDGIDAVARVDRVRARLAYVAAGAVAGGMASLRVGEYLRFLRIARGTRPGAGAQTTPRDAISRAGLSDDHMLGALAPEARQRVALAGALSCGADVLLLDEPCELLGDADRLRFVEWLREARDNGSTIVAAFGQRIDAIPLCHSAVVLTDGRASAMEKVLA